MYIVYGLFTILLTSCYCFVAIMLIIVNIFLELFIVEIVLQVTFHPFFDGVIC